MATGAALSDRWPALARFAERLHRANALFLALAAPLFAMAIALTLSQAREATWDGLWSMPLLRASINYTRDDHPGLIVHEAGPPARTAGVRPGDRIVAINGLAPDAGLDTIAPAEDGTVARLTLARGATRTTAAIPLRRAHAEQLVVAAGFSLALLDRLTSLSALLNGAVGIVAAIVLFLRARGSRVARMLTIAALGIIAADPVTLPGELAMVLYFAFFTLLNIAILGFPDAHYRGLVGRGMLLANVVAFALSFLDTRLAGTLVPASLAINVAGMWWQLRAGASPLVRQQRRWAMLGFGGAALGALGVAALAQFAYVNNDLASVIWNDIASSLLDAVAWTLLFAGLIVALLRYRLYDADAVLTRAAIWVIAAPILALIFAVITDVIKQFLVPLLGGAGFAAPIAGAMTALLIQPVSDAIRLRVERWARRELNDLRIDLPAAIEDLRETDDRALLLNHICARIAPAVRADEVAIVTQADGGWQLAAATGDEAVRDWLTTAQLDDRATLPRIERGDVRFPLRLPLTAWVDGSQRALGWLLIGRRPDGSIQDAPAREALSAIAPTLGRALHVIAQRERRWRDLAERLRRGG